MSVKVNLPTLLSTEQSNPDMLLGPTLCLFVFTVSSIGAVWMEGNPTDELNTNLDLTSLEVCMWGFTQQHYSSL